MQVPGKGRGLVASRTFGPGETIASEQAVLWFPHWELGTADGAMDMVRVAPAHRDYIEGLLLQMAPYMADSPDAAGALARDGEMSTLTRSQLISSVALEAAFGVRVESSRTWTAAAAATDASSSSSSSSAESLPAHLRTIDAVCPVLSLCNHDCAPNAAWTVEGPRSLAQGVTLKLVAQRVIQTGAEITIAYKPSTASPRQARRGALQAQYGFRCGCKRCASLDYDDTVAFACVACGKGPVRLHSLLSVGDDATTKDGDDAGNDCVSPQCAACGAGGEALPAGSGVDASGILAGDALTSLLQQRASVTTASLPQLLSHSLLHAADVALFEARFNAIGALLQAVPASETSDVRLSPAVAAPLRTLAHGALQFLPSASGYLETFKRKRVMRDAALALALAEVMAPSSDGAKKQASTQIGSLYVQAAEIEVSESGAGSPKAKLLGQLASDWRKVLTSDAAVRRAYDALTNG